MHPGQRIGKYVLGERIAVGGMAEVWAARVEGPQGFVKTLALKFILESFSGDPELERLFVNEARIAAQLQHANLVTVFDFDKIGAEQERGLAGRYYIAMERVEGFDLRRIAGAAQSAGYVFPERLALHLGGEVLKALRYVHERKEGAKHLGLVHRDVSPHNVLVGYSGEVKLSDFGIAKARAQSGAGTKTGTIRGKLSYASPEQLNGEVVDHRTDQFALGVTLWELLAGRRLFDGDDEMEIIGKVVRCQIPSIANPQSARGVDPAIDAVVRRMLSARRDDRYPTTADALTAVLSLPAYSGDGAAVGDLVRTLFLPSAELPVTMPIEVPRPAAAGLPETKTRHPEARPARPAQEPARVAASSKAATKLEAPDGTFGAAVIDTDDVRGVPRHRGALLVAVAVVLAAGSLAVVMTQRSPPTEAAASGSSAEPAVVPAAKPAVEIPAPPAPPPPRAELAAPAPPPAATAEPVPAAPPTPVTVTAEPLREIAPLAEIDQPAKRPEVSTATKAATRGQSEKHRGAPRTRAAATIAPVPAAPPKSRPSPPVNLATPKPEPRKPEPTKPTSSGAPTAPPPASGGARAPNTNGAPILE